MQKQILNGYKSCYYLTEAGEVYNAETKEILTADKEHRIRLKEESGKSKRITLKELYRLVYNVEYSEDNIKDLENEHWKPIERTDNLYWISDKGRVKSLKGYKAILLKYNLINGYRRVDIVQNKSRSSKLVQRLVASAFLLPPKSIDMQIHHINGIKTDNNKENLIWLTPEDHRKAHKLMREEKKHERN